MNKKTPATKNFYYASLATVILVFNSCTLGRFVFYNFADIQDHKIFQANPVRRSGPVFSFIYPDSSKSPSSFIPVTVRVKGKAVSFDQFLEASRTRAFLIIKNDTVIYEKYFHKYNKGSIVPSFSMAKAFVSALIGIAIDEGFIKNVDQPVTDFLPELKKKKGFDKITIEHLLNMRSGIKFNEGYYNPLGNIAQLYYGTNIKKHIRKLETNKEPGTMFEYKSINSQLLGIILQRATGKTLAAYLQEKIWQPLGMEYDASWSIDSKKNNTEKAFCCINARARDYAKFGRLFLQEGNWEGKQIISKEWIKRSTLVTEKSPQYDYSYQWWHTTNFKIVPDSTTVSEKEKVYSYKSKSGKIVKYKDEPGNDFYAQGILGQFIYINPAKKIVIVRLGKNYGQVYWADFFRKMCDGKLNGPINN